ncbi:hypothetical protein PP301_gp017 [Gordonia phage GMA2]|uniref:Uncharacterized protein n=1 Tax=Gordonia phage GMA2 TaxID=1647283 RepID=A0A0K0N6U7_9CAUD|nr:hypothetical protein PP301_gp017 [Gordonia phage GMA2]AKJ72555.1 hypothetical protein GMA2_17 [Gordonia phage GMA2]
MARFFETFNVIEQDGPWSRGPQPVDTLSAGVSIQVRDICDPEPVDGPPDFDIGDDTSPFAITAYSKVPTRCAPSEIQSYVESAMRESTEYVVTKALWSGTTDNPDTKFYLGGDDVTVVSRSSNDMYDLLGKVLHKAYEDTPFIKPVIHLGFQSAMALQLGLQNLGLPFVVAAGYPQDAIAVTGPVTVRLGTIETTSAVETSDNRMQIESTRLARIEFDPYMAVRAQGSTGS